MFVYHESEQYDFERVGVKGKIFPTEILSEKAGFVIIETDIGHETTIIEHDSDFIYYILAGSGYFVINDSTEECNAGDLVVIPAEHRFTYKGKLRMLLINTPIWSEKQEEVL